MYIGDNWFRIPYTYSFPFHLGGRIQMIIGCNFIRSMYGGVRIEGDSVTFYKNVITIQTRQSVNLLEEAQHEDDELIIDHYYDHPEEWNMGRLLSPLYSKVSPKGERRLNSQDWALIRQIKAQIRKLPSLSIPPEDCVIVLEVDGCMEGWGGICKWKAASKDPHSTERICSYASENCMCREYETSYPQYTSCLP